MNRMSCWKLPMAMATVLVPSLLAGCSDHDREGHGGGAGPDARPDAAVTPPPPQGPPPPKPFIADKFATPYAVVATVGPPKPGENPCPDKPSWNVVRPANGDQKTPAVRSERPGQAAFCVYKWAGTKLPTEQDFKQIGGKPELPVLGISGPAVAPKDLPEDVYGPLRARFERRASGFAPADLERLKPIEAKARTAAKPAAKAEPAAEAAPLPPVKLAIVDATPRALGMTTPDRSGHGFDVSRIAGTLACADPNSDECTKRVVVPYLALPIIDEVQGDYTEDWKTGGRTGTMVHLYDALEAAIDEWLPHRNQQHLVINLSLGWDPIKLDPKDSTVVAIQTLLETAWCHGALIVAAAGNFTGSPGPIYPAAFESLPAPKPDRCLALLPKGTKPAVIPGNRYAPLVHSVGAVDTYDKRTLVNRRWGQPRLSALGADVTVPGPTGMPSIPAMNGTSAATAIASGIATRIWAAQPRLDAAGVMQAIYDGGALLKVGQDMERPQTEYCMGHPYGPCVGPVRRAYLCGAMARAIPSLKPKCDDSLPAQGPHWPKPVPPPPPPRPAQACNLTECGIPYGPVENQLPAAVGGHGVGNCAGCTFHVDTGTGTITLNGTPTTSVPPTWMLGSTAVLNTDVNPAVLINAQFGVPFNNMPVPGMNPATSQAWITWTVQVANIGTITTNNPLGPN